MNATPAGDSFYGVQARMNYYERHIGDYLRDTAHLSLLEHGVYGRLLDVYYTREGPIPADQAARLIGARSKDERAALDVVMAEFFTVAPGQGMRHRRCDREIERLADKRRKASASANARWAASNAHSEGGANAMRTHSEGIADAMRTHSEGNARAPVPRHQAPDTTLVPKVQRGAPQASPRRGARLPPDWDPGETGRSFAETQGLTNGRVTAELSKFRDFWTAKAGADAAKADWQATWRNWVRRAMEGGPNGARPAAGSDPFEGAH